MYVRFVIQECHYCGGVSTTRDHIVPRSLVRKLHLPENHPFWAEDIVPSCGPCNVEKGSEDSGCTCPRCEEAWRLYFSLERERNTQDERRLVYSSDDEMSGPVMHDSLIWLYEELTKENDDR